MCDEGRDRLHGYVSRHRKEVSGKVNECGLVGYDSGRGPSDDSYVRVNRTSIHPRHLFGTPGPHKVLELEKPEIFLLYLV